MVIPYPTMNCERLSSSPCDGRLATLELIRLRATSGGPHAARRITQSPALISRRSRPAPIRRVASAVDESGDERNDLVGDLVTVGLAEFVPRTLIDPDVVSALGMASTAASDVR